MSLRIVALEKIVSDPARHEETEPDALKLIADGPAPCVADHEPLDPFRRPAREVQTDRAAPVLHDQGAVLKIAIIQQGFELAPRDL